MSSTQRPIEGVIPAPLSSFDGERNFDYDAFARRIEYLVEEGVHGVFLAGTTAEGAYITAEERSRAADTVRRIAGDAVTIYAVVIRPGTRQVIQELTELKGTPVTTVAAVTPFYMDVDQREVETHYREIADASPLPLMLYNIPQNTKNRLCIETVIRLSDHPNIVGIKDSSGDFMAFVHGMLSVEGGFAWIQGEDRLDAPSLLMGAPGIVTGLGNVNVRPHVEMYRAVQAGDREKALDCQRRINAMARIIDAADGKVIQAIKTGASMLGRGNSRMRLPAMDLTPAQAGRVRETMREVGLL